MQVKLERGGQLANHFALQIAARKRYQPGTVKMEPQRNVPPHGGLCSLEYRTVSGPRRHRLLKRPARATRPPASVSHGWWRVLLSALCQLEQAKSSPPTVAILQHRVHSFAHCTARATRPLGTPCPVAISRFLSPSLSPRSQPIKATHTLTHSAIPRKYYCKINVFLPIGDYSPSLALSGHCVGRKKRKWPHLVRLYV